jgi:hypothetical protein
MTATERPPRRLLAATSTVDARGSAVGCTKSQTAASPSLRLLSWQVSNRTGPTTETAAELDSNSLHCTSRPSPSRALSRSAVMSVVCSRSVKTAERLPTTRMQRQYEASCSTHASLATRTAEPSERPAARHGNRRPNIFTIANLFACHASVSSLLPLAARARRTLARRRSRRL